MTRKKEKNLLTETTVSDFANNNPHTIIEYKDTSIIIKNPWGQEDCILRGNINDESFIATLNSIRIDPRFDAIIHDEDNMVEVFYTYLDPNDSSDKEIINRAFTVFFEGKEYKCKFAEPSHDFKNILKSFKRLPHDHQDTTAYQLDMFADAKEAQSPESNLPDFIIDFFKSKQPRNFFIKSETSLKESDLCKLCKHLNVLFSYYDRNSPHISIRRKKSEEATNYNKPIRFIDGNFPQKLRINNIDDIIIKLLSVARETQPRFAFLYSYQVLEYAAHYYIDNKSRSKIRNILMDPSILSCNDEQFNKFFSVLNEMNQDDKTKMRLVVEEYCDPCIIWKEIENNREFFESEHNLEGGFKLPALIAPGIGVEEWKGMWTPKLYDVLCKIRNAIVHSREKRELKVILPTDENNKVLSNYVPVISRVAMLIALKADI